MMKYTLLNQGYGTVDTFSSITVTDRLSIEVFGANPGDVMKIVSDAPYYANITDGHCVFPKKTLVGEISVCIVTTNGTIPCTGLIAIPMENGAVMVMPNAKEVLSRLQKAERDISSLIESRIALEKKYNGLESRIAKLFDGHNF